MALKRLRFATLLLAALALTMEWAHVLELPQKLQYDAALYSAVNTTLYRYFAIVGGPLQIASIIAAALLALAMRRRRAAWGSEALGCLALAAAFAVWLAVVAPVNGMIAATLGSAPQEVAAQWMALRLRWELGHVAGFVLQLLGFSALIGSVLRDTPRHRPALAVSHAVLLFDRALPASSSMRRRG
jgi:hypothetical protein